MSLANRFLPDTSSHIINLKLLFTNMSETDCSPYYKLLSNYSFYILMQAYVERVYRIRPSAANKSSIRTEYINPTTTTTLFIETIVGWCNKPSQVTWWQTRLPTLSWRARIIVVTPLLYTVVIRQKAIYASFWKRISSMFVTNNKVTFTHNGVR